MEIFSAMLQAHTSSSLNQSLDTDLYEALPCRRRPCCGKHTCRQGRFSAISTRQTMHSRGAMCSRDASSLLSC